MPKEIRTALSEIYHNYLKTILLVALFVIGVVAMASSFIFFLTKDIPVEERIHRITVSESHNI